MIDLHRLCDLDDDLVEKSVVISAFTRNPPQFDKDADMPPDLVQRGHLVLICFLSPWSARLTWTFRTVPCPRVRQAFSPLGWLNEVTANGGHVAARVSIRSVSFYFGGSGG